MTESLSSRMAQSTPRAHKMCPKCELTLPAEAFGRHRNRPGGLSPYCRECHAALMRQRRKATNERDALRQRYRTDPEYRLKVRARSRVNMLKRRAGAPEEPCVLCGAPNAEAHHDTYEKPLDVSWLCKRCHEVVHHG